MNQIRRFRRFQAGDTVLVALGSGLGVRAGTLIGFECFPPPGSPFGVVESCEQPESEHAAEQAYGQAWWRAIVMLHAPPRNPFCPSKVFVSPRHVSEHDIAMTCAACGGRVWLRDSYSPADEAVCPACARYREWTIDVSLQVPPRVEAGEYEGRIWPLET